MAAPRFAAVPNIPMTGLTDWQSYVLSALKENVEILTGARGGTGGRAVVSGNITVAAVPTGTMTRVTAQGASYTISGVTVPSADDYVKLLTNVQELANDVATLRASVNALLIQLKG
jgi:hypothetical protein